MMRNAQRRNLQARQFDRADAQPNNGMQLAVPRAAADAQRWATQGEYLANCLVPWEPDGERLVAYLERRTPWDS
jgi:hypothetical protein